jgi:hypothetical protein
MAMASTATQTMLKKYVEQDAGLAGHLNTAVSDGLLFSTLSYARTSSLG